MVWVWLAAITFIEVFLGYERLRPDLMLTLLVVLSLVKAALIVSYFMHLKYEKIESGAAVDSRQRYFASA